MQFRKNFAVFLFFASIFCSLHADIFYKVRFWGLEDKKALQAIKDHSDLLEMQDRSIPSVTALRYRIDDDIPEILSILQSFSYYDAKVCTNISLEYQRFVVDVVITPGPQYLLKDLDVFTSACEAKVPLPQAQGITLNDLEVQKMQPITTGKILDAQTLLLERLAANSFPLATITKRDVVVDVLTKTISVTFCVDPGPFSHFGSTTILGLKDVDPKFIERKIAWEEGAPYDLDDITLTQKRLMKSNLFGSVLVSHTGELDESGELPMKIKLTESKHQSFNFGVSYATIDGPGASIGWEHRNIAHLGQLLSMQVDVSKVASTGIATYKIPDFYKLDRDYIWQAMVVREDVVPYIGFTYRLGNRLEWNISETKHVSLGLKGEYINVVKSISNGKFTFLGLPLYVNYSTASSLLDPTSGLSIAYKMTPYQAISHNRTFFLKQTLTGGFYIPFIPSRRVVMAIRLQLGSIAGSNLSRIPFTKRFLGGSDDNLRGYRFKTVSPTNSSGDPLGGRSAVYATVEMRFRVSESVGVVPFSDFGTVSLKQYPDFTTKWFKSVGLGLRYFTFFGPLRLDVAVPLDKRKRDPNYRIYLSFGQTF
ncbi:MAG: hypothetical protein COT84_05545 [Chlamydiae bacterium CG10_big_fil_rev_8_21_14_0_10_35_9]|nr:MAG: hypothetical protein COT84_05545 [Chlamydiae bacterium CG10_big_fil_rev_8_21_14_0_10_35_9]